MKKGKQLSSKDKTLLPMKCMNHNPEESKWGMYAPAGGCKEYVNVDNNVTKVLCSFCTSATTSLKHMPRHLK